MKVSVNFLWYDFWIGLYYDRRNKTLYFCPFPTIVFSFKRDTPDRDIPLNKVRTIVMDEFSKLSDKQLNELAKTEYIRNMIILYKDKNLLD